VPADTAVALGAFLAGRGTLAAWAVFGVTWTANVGSAAAVYALARRYGQGFFRGRLGRRLLSERTLERIGREYERHGPLGIFLARLLPVWRGVVPPFAGLSGVSAPRALIPIALASACYYGALTFLVARLGHDLEKVLAVLENVNIVLGALGLALLAAVAYAFWRRR
ncbi:MAG: DedA family protein, partial [Gemmatimonadales bacterium]